jgi:spore germination cell wall hydrolase CwlJ-like protein
MIKELTLIGMLIDPTADVECLAKNMYYESRNQSMAGMLAVTNVVLNRVEDVRFPNDICSVIQQGPTAKSITDSNKEYPIRNQCQFSWYCDGKADEPIDIKAYAYTRGLAYEIIHGTFPYIDITEGALFYHADYVTPEWSVTFKQTLKLNDHIFYKWD